MVNGMQQSRQKIMIKQLAVPQADRLTLTAVIPLNWQFWQVTLTGCVEVILVMKASDS